MADAGAARSDAPVPPRPLRRALEALAGSAGDERPGLDPLIHERVRLGLLSALSANERLSFNEAKQLLNTTDGNLSVHARKLEDAGYLDVRKGYRGRVPHTEYVITPVGRGALEAYLDHMEALIRAVRD